MPGFEMNTSLDHLSVATRETLARVVSVITSFEQVSLVILFGSYARGDYVVDPVGNDEDGHPYFSDLDICVLVDKPRKARRIERSNALREQLRAVSDIRVSVITHTANQFNRALEAGEYFYVDVAKDGIQLANPCNVAISQPKNLTPEERAAKAKEDYDYWMGVSDEFLRQYEHAINDNSLRMAAFNLHQVAENALTAACLVLSGYRPKGHDLAELETWCAQFDPAFRDVFPKSTPDDERLFELLNKAYVGARYKKTFTIDADDLAALARRINELRRRAALLAT